MKRVEAPRSLSRAACSLCKRPQPRTTSRYLPTAVPRIAFSTSHTRPASIEESASSSELQPVKSNQTDAQQLVDASDRSVLARLRVVPASAAYFSAQPNFLESLLELQAIQRKHETLPIVSPADAPRTAWKNLIEYKSISGAEPIKVAKYHKITNILKRLNRIHPALMPQDVTEILLRYRRHIQPHLNRPKAPELDLEGKAKGVGRRKTSTAIAWLIEGEGEVMINGKSLNEAFGRVHDRESVIWALKCSQRVDKYNVFAVVKGGGLTGQAEALTLAIAKALLVHEPALKTVLRVGGCITRDPRSVERKKPGHLKARKKPTWVKR